MTPAHYLKEMEFYYQKPKPERVGPFLKILADSGQIATSEDRLMLGAFMAELIRSGAIDAEWLARQCQNLGPEARRMAAWSLHLAQSDKEKALLDKLLDATDGHLLWQINASPSPLAKWNPDSEDTVLMMYLGAFMASGNTDYLDAIVGVAIGQGAQANHAASLLYELLPDHPVIAERLRAAGKNASETQKETINLILRRLR